MRKLLLALLLSISTLAQAGMVQDAFERKQDWGVMLQNEKTARPNVIAWDAAKRMGFLVYMVKGDTYHYLRESGAAPKNMAYMTWCERKFRFNEPDFVVHYTYMNADDLTAPELTIFAYAKSDLCDTFAPGWNKKPEPKIPPLERSKQSGLN